VREVLFNNHIKQSKCPERKRLIIYKRRLRMEVRKRVQKK